FAELELDVVEGKRALVLLDERVLRLDEDAHQRLLIQRRHRADDREPADELGDEAELQQVFRRDAREHFAEVVLVAVLDGRAETHRLATDTALDDLVEAGKRTTAY